jgi:UDP-glucose 4-epimerase
MRVLITGGTGFIGRHLLERMPTGTHTVLSIVRKDTHTFLNSCSNLIGDLNDLSKIKGAICDFNPDIVIHLAWEGIPDYSEKISKINLENSIQLFDFLIEETNCKKIIIAGSCYEYGKINGSCIESDLTSVNSFFSWAKHSLFHYLEIKCAQKKITWVWFRIFYVFGPGQRAQSLFPVIVRFLRKKEVPSIMVPFNKNDFIYVSDVTDATWLAVEKDIPAGIYNLGTGDSSSVYKACEFAEKVIFGANILTEQVKEKGKREQNVNFWADMTKTQLVLDWMPKVSLEEGIKLQLLT